MRIRFTFMTVMTICVFWAIFATVAPTPASARWLEGGNSVCDTSGHQADPYIIVADDGNWIIVWYDGRAGQYDLYANKMDLRGNFLWGAHGVRLCDNSSTQSDPKAVSDGAGGAVVVWEDHRAGYDIYAQRIDTYGNVVWPLSGVAVCTATSMQEHPEICSDGAGGAIFTWYDGRNVSDDIFIQRVDSAGTVMWTTDGAAVCTQPYHQIGPKLAPDGESGAFIAWVDRRNASYNNVYAQRVSYNGYPQWTPDGIPVDPSTDEQGYLDIIEDGTGGAIVVWGNRETIYYEMYATRISADSQMVWGGAVELYAGGGDQMYPVVTSDGNGGAIAIWEDWTNGITNKDLRAQRVDFLGNPMWSGGVAICTSPGVQVEPQLCSDGFGGAIFTWTDQRLLELDIYAQRVDASGSALWDDNGAVVTQMPNDQIWPTIAPDGEAGAILTYADFRDGQYYKAYVQRIERNGYWGYPAPHITGVRDIPGDQGGCVNLSWDASRLDPWPDMLISSYTVWRAISPTAAVARKDAGVRMIDTPAAFAAGSGAEIILSGELGGQTYYWYLIDTVDPYYLPGYSVLAATLFDSTSTSDEYHYFQVIAHTSDPQIFWVSDPDSGYSVDNIGPDAPTSLAGEQIQTPTGLRLTWDSNTEADLSGYRIYRGLSEDFTPGPGNMIIALPDTNYLDGEWLWDSGYYYKVSAVDVHGNESPFAGLGPEIVVGTGEGALPVRTALEQNRPNPFNPETTIRFSLAEKAFVNLAVFDARGRLVRTLVLGEQSPDVYEVRWKGVNDAGTPVASGVYFCRLKAGSFSQIRKLVLLK